LLQTITSSDHFYDYVTLAVIFLACFNAAEVLFLLYNKTKIERSERKRQNLKRLASTALITATNPADLLPKPETEDEFAAYSEAIASVLDSFEGEVAEKASRLLTGLGIDTHYRRLARHRTWYKRGNAIDILSSFRLRANKEFFLAVFRSEPTAEVKYRILYGLSRLVRGHEEIKELARLLVRKAPPKSLAFIFDPALERHFTRVFERHLLARFKKAVGYFRAREYGRGVKAMRGLGLGLTPSGDDFISGLLAGLNFARQSLRFDADSLIEKIYFYAEGGNLVSNSFLRCSYEGRVNAKIRRVMTALARRNKRELAAAAMAALRSGHTSGADYCSGLVFALLEEFKPADK